MLKDQEEPDKWIGLRGRPFPAGSFFIKASRRSDAAADEKERRCTGLGTADRRCMIMKTLFTKKHITIQELALHFGVSERTIRRDIEQLSLSEPIYTQPGKYGGIYIMEDYRKSRAYSDYAQNGVLVKILRMAETREACILDAEEIRLLKKLAAGEIKLFV